MSILLVWFLGVLYSVILLIIVEEKWFYLVEIWIYIYIDLNLFYILLLKGSMWTACALSIFQLLSDDYISYVFFILFVGIAIGAVQVITVPYVIEMVRNIFDFIWNISFFFQFPTESRAIYGLLLTGLVFLFDLIIPGLAYVIKNWKILQGVVSIPLILTSVLYWYV